MRTCTNINYDERLVHTHFATETQVFMFANIDTRSARYILYTSCSRISFTTCKQRRRHDEQTTTRSKNKFLFPRVLTRQSVDGAHSAGPVVTLVERVAHDDGDGDDPADPGRVVDLVGVGILDPQAGAEAVSGVDGEPGGTLLRKNKERNLKS